MKNKITKAVFISLVALASNAFAQVYGYGYNYPQSMTSEVQTCQREIKGDLFEKEIHGIKDLSQKTKFYCKALQPAQIEYYIDYYKEEIDNLKKTNKKNFNEVKANVKNERKCMAAFDNASDNAKFENLDSNTQKDCKKFEEDFKFKQMFKQMKMK